MITLICPTRGRPEQLARMWRSAQATAARPDNLTLAVGLDENDSENYSGALPLGVRVYYLPDAGIVYGVNYMVENLLHATQSRLFMIAPDDVVFTTPLWDKALIDHYEALKNKKHVYCLRDSRDANGTPHPILTREYIKAMGYFFPPIFLHWYVDSWTAEIAKSNGVFTHLTDYELMHDKPSDRGLQDNTHLRVRQRGWWHRDTFVNNTCQGYLALEKARLADALDDSKTIAQRFRA